MINGDNVVLAADGMLAAGIEGAAGRTTYTFAGGGGLDLSAATAGANNGWLKFDLGSSSTAGTTYDQIRLAGGALNIGDGLNFSDFDFTLLSGFGPGTYVLFETPVSILGSLGTTLTGDLNGYESTLSVSGNNLILTVIPEPGSIVPPPVLVESGQPRAEIVMAEHPARLARLAASELQTYIEKISGATLPIVTEPSGEVARIYVGISPYTEALGLETEGLKYGAYRMASGPGWLALLGPDKDFEPVEPWGRLRSAGERLRINQAWDEITGDTFWNPFHSLFMWYNPEFDFWAFDDRGTLHAVYDFLHDLGVRWYMPGELGEVVPELLDIPLPTVHATVRPDYSVRRLNWFQAHQPVSAEDALWRLRLRLHPGHDVLGITQQVHGMKYVHQRDEMKAAHPEFYALRDGERATGHKGGQGAPCLSSEGLFDKHVAYVRAVFDHFGEPMLSIDLVDGFGGVACECEACRAQYTPERGAQGRLSDYVWGYLNRVAEALYESHPDRWVSGLTYGAYALPPENLDTMAPNLVLFLIPPRMTLGEPEVRAAYEASRDDWMAKLASGRVFTWSNVLFNWQINAWWGVPVYFPRLLAHELREGEGSVEGEQLECYEHIPGQYYGWDAQSIAHLTLYTYARFWWNTEQDIEAMLDEYATLFYGPAREEMKAFIEHCEENWPRMRREIEPIDQALALLDAAKAATVSGSVYRQRIDLIIQYTQPLEALRIQLGREREDVPRARILQQSALAGKELDGRLDDVEYWPEVRTLTLVDIETGALPPAGLRSWTRVFWANNAAYFGIYCAEPDMAGLLDRIAAGSANAGIREGDFVEILLETLTHSYYRITVSPSGVVVDADMSEGGVNEAWASSAEAAVHLGDNFWSVEVRIPLAGEGARLMDPYVGVDGRMPTQTYTWYFNVGRQRVRDGLVQRWSYSPTGSHEFDVPERFAELWGGSDLRAGDYIAAVSAPTFHPDGGKHAGSSVHVTVTCTTEGATIRYTTNGEEPTEASATVTSGGSVSVPVPGTLRAQAWKDGMNPSAVKSISYMVLRAAMGTPYHWLIQHDLVSEGNSSAAFDAAELSDPQGKGQPVYQDYIGGSDPNDPQSFFRMASPGAGHAGGIILNWHGLEGRAYRIYRSTTMTLPAADWPMIGTVFATADGPVSYADTDPALADGGTFFYRIRVLLAE